MEAVVLESIQFCIKPARRDPTRFKSKTQYSFSIPKTISSSSQESVESEGFFYSVMIESEGFIAVSPMEPELAKVKRSSIQNMKGGRKNLKRAVEAEMMTPQQGQNIMQVVELRGNNLIEVMDAKGEKLLAIFPAKFHKSMWIKRGNFVVVDESGREEAVESGRKVAGILTQVLYHDQVRLLQKSSDWPEIFKSSSQETSNQDLQLSISQEDDEYSSDDEGLPPLEANTNRVNPLLLHLDTDSASDSDIENDS